MQARDPLVVPRDPSAAAEDAFVERCIVAVARGADADVPAPTPGDRWAERAARHGVYLQVLTALKHAGRSLTPQLEDARRAAVFRALGAKADLRALGVALDDAGVDWALVKGPILADVVYRRRGSRDCTDLDILVRPARLPDAVRALETIGARRLGVDWSQRTWAQGSEIPLIMPSGVVLDLHWHLSNRPSLRRAFGLDTDDLMDAARTYDLGGISVPGLDDLDTVLHVLLHACSDGCGRLRPLLDAQQCVLWLRSLGRTPSELAARATARRLSSPAWVVLMLVASTLDGSVAPWAEALWPRTRWDRFVVARARRPQGSPLVDGLTRRLVRYVAPTSIASARGVAGYGLDRVRRLVRGDRTQVRGLAGAGTDAAFEEFLRRAG